MSTKIPKQSTIEDLINNLDQRGLLVFYVLLGQRAMQVLSQTKSDVLSEDKAKEVSNKPSSLLLPNPNIPSDPIILRGTSNSYG